MTTTRIGSLPRQRSAEPPWAAGGAEPPRDPGGSITVEPRVVEKVAVQAVREVPDAGPARSRGARARMSGGGVTVRLRIVVRYPVPAGEVADRVRARVRERVEWVTGGRVHYVDIEIAELVR
ncbi:Asp23/Gls24 family envelope stress response protein [Nocardiopsis sp. CNT312]|uniref:Asp23/Gls24 family envelope stress response protein n=1 Tax=Nocardiopsis sp. CNT312 TaxID=1137268 RepID=UPI00048B5829|nr:Asp23/Gls24 family envelope stress response protein [Nocardiopsis sp. CNT312]